MAEIESSRSVEVPEAGQLVHENASDRNRRGSGGHGGQLPTTARGGVKADQARGEGVRVQVRHREL
jgi:hypothetical protein